MTTKTFDQIQVGDVLRVTTPAHQQRRAGKLVPIAEKTVVARVLAIGATSISHLEKIITCGLLVEADGREWFEEEAAGVRLPHYTIYVPRVAGSIPETIIETFER